MNIVIIQQRKKSRTLSLFLFTLIQKSYTRSHFKQTERQSYWTQYFVGEIFAKGLLEIGWLWRFDGRSGVRGAIGQSLQESNGQGTGDSSQILMEYFTIENRLISVALGGFLSENCW